VRVLIYSPTFHPNVGGLETVTRLLAEGLHEIGHEIVVICTTPSAAPEPFGFRVVRNPGWRDLLRLSRWCEVYFQSNVSLKGLWPLLLVRRPWVVSHHSWYCQSDGRITWRDRLKRWLLRRAAASIAVSRAIADDLGSPALVIGNPYRDDLFRRLDGVDRDTELVFLGRLVSDKGCDLLLDALARLADSGLRPRLTIVGDGPEAPRLSRQMHEHGLEERVTMAGLCQGEELVRLLNGHRILVVPSRYDEPFGIVALEGLACGCRVVGSEGGGLRDAIGPGGWTFPNGDAAALAELLGRVLRGELPEPDPEAVRDHLARHARARIVAAYAAVIERIGDAHSPDRTDDEPSATP